MTRLPRITGLKLVAALRKAGFIVLCIKGSHHFLQHPDGRLTIVPVHRGETLGPGILSQILHDCEITPEELRELL